MKNISKIAVLMTAVLISVTAYGQKIYKRIIWDAKITCAKCYPYIPKIDYTKKTLDFYETPPANIVLYLERASKDTRNYEFHNIRDEFAMRNKKSWFNADTLDYSMIETYRSLICKIIKGDTLVIKVNNEPVTKCKLSEYVAKAPINAKMAWLKTHQDQFAANRRVYLATMEKCKRHNAKMQAEYEKDSVVAANSLAVYKRAIEDQQERREQERKANEAAKARKRILCDLDADISDPARPLQTKTITNVKGAKATYQYYVNDNGYEVKHGKFTETMIFNNFKYWTGLSKYGWVYLDGTESCTCYYKNGIVHGRVTYSSNISASSTFGNDELLKNNISFDVYKGVITGDFKFTYEGITYTGKATNGILDYCDYETNDGYHGKLTSNSSGNEISIPVIDNGYRKFEFNVIIQLPCVGCKIPGFYFPRIGE